MGAEEEAPKGQRGCSTHWNKQSNPRHGRLGSMKAFGMGAKKEVTDASTN